MIDTECSQESFQFMGDIVPHLRYQPQITVSFAKLNAHTGKIFINELQQVVHQLRLFHGLTGWLFFCIHFNAPRVLRLLQ